VTGETELVELLLVVFCTTVVAIVELTTAVVFPELPGATIAPADTDTRLLEP